jgi:undecaprenyl diphosphate synthase
MKRDLKKLIDPSNLPRHVAIIMDGNGRWAQKRNKSRLEGHKAGAKSVKEIVETAKELGIKFLTLYSFSKENWGRPKKEVNGLMKLLYNYLGSQVKNLMKHNIKLNAIGDLDDLPLYVRKRLREVMEKTRNNDGMVLTLALSYSGRNEILRAVNKVLKEGKKEITEEEFRKYLDTAGIPDPDLLIRTGGEMRISNFLLYQIAYTEFYITRTFWPDFRKREFYKAIIDYQKRERRFGLTSEQIRKK